eukprot:2838370-Pleurochrysis_carterae.AAC.1
MSARQSPPVAGASAAPGAVADAGAAPADPGSSGSASARSPTGTACAPTWRAAPDSIDCHQALARMWAQLPSPGSTVVAVSLSAAGSFSDGRAS